MACRLFSPGDDPVAAPGERAVVERNAVRFDLPGVHPLGTGLSGQSSHVGTEAAVISVVLPASMSARQPA